MKRFKEISKKIVSIKAFSKKTYLDDEDKDFTMGIAAELMRPARDELLLNVRLACTRMDGWMHSSLF